MYLYSIGLFLFTSHANLFIKMRVLTYVVFNYFYVLFCEYRLRFLSDVCVRNDEIKMFNYHNGPLTRYVKLRVAHAPGMPGTFTLPPTSKETAS